MSKGVCTICKGKCHWNDHKNMNFYFKSKMVQNTVRADNLFEAYKDANSNLTKSKQIIEGLKKDSEMC